MTSLSTLTDILVEQLGINPEQVEPSARLADLGADSLDHVEIVMALDQEFGLDITDEDSDKFVTVGDILNYIEREAGGECSH